MAKINFWHRYVRPSVCPFASAPLPLDGCFMNICKKFFRETINLVNVALYRVIKNSLCTWWLIQCIRTIPTQLMVWIWPSFEMWTVLYWTRASRTQFGVSVNIWRLAEDTLNITRKFLYCNYQMHRDFLLLCIKLCYIVLYYISIKIKFICIIINLVRTIQNLPAIISVISISCILEE
jgi:hypothetical protein